MVRRHRTPPEILAQTTYHVDLARVYPMGAADTTEKPQNHPQKPSQFGLRRPPIVCRLHTATLNCCTPDSAIFTTGHLQTHEAVTPPAA